MSNNIVDQAYLAGALYAVKRAGINPATIWDMTGTEGLDKLAEELAPQVVALKAAAEQDEKKDEKKDEKPKKKSIAGETARGAGRGAVSGALVGGLGSMGLGGAAYAARRANGQRPMDLTKLLKAMAALGTLGGGAGALTGAATGGIVRGALS